MNNTDLKPIISLGSNDQGEPRVLVAPELNRLTDVQLLVLEAFMRKTLLDLNDFMRQRGF